ncbi:MAG: rhomboid family intramembrane serine protease [Acidobacteria bacterium]|nr:rhomboid family intramembrane serine protease [Acidobacteriota bacterium]
MIPLRDNVPRTSWPWVTLVVIVANCYVFFHEIAVGPLQRTLMIHTYGLIPARTTAFFTGVHVSAAEAFGPFFSSMFLHGGWLHLIGNMWFLWIFGDNVEDRVGHFRYVCLYVLCGLSGAVTFYYFSFNSTIPTVGASGAIAGIMGAYLVTFPGARVLTLVPIFVFLTRVEIPAFVMLIYWLLVQFASGVISMNVQQQGGVAWFAHVGGFLAGIPLMLLLRRPRRRRIGL